MNLLKSMATISCITLLSRILGFIRDTIIARTFGADIAIDSFIVAFKLPNLLRRIFAEGAFSQSFMPILMEYKRKQDHEEVRIFVSYILGLLTLVLFVVTIIGIIAAPWIISIIAPGFTNTIDKFILTTSLLRITFPYILLVSLTSLIGAILNSWDCFSIPAFTPALLNISIICFSLFISRFFHPQVMALAWAVIVGGILQLFYQLPQLKKIEMLVLPRINLRNKGVWRIICQMGPAIIGVSINQISLIINTIFASFLVSGSVSWIYYADRLMEFPSGILGVTLSTILLPSLAKNFTNGNCNEYSQVMDWGLRICFMLVLPSAVALGVLSGPVIMALFEYGKFTTFDASMTQKTLIAYSVGLIGLSLVKVLAPGFYSRQDVKTPVKIAIITFLITQLMNLIFIGPLKHVGLALSVGLGSCCNAILLYWQLRKKNIFSPQSGWCSFLVKLMISLIFMTLILIAILKIMPSWEIGQMWLRLLRLVFVILIGGCSYFTMLGILGFRPKDFVRHTLT